MKAKTKAGSITIGPETVIIDRRSITRAGGESRVVRLDDVTGVEYRPATILSPGHLKLIHSGNKSSALKMRDYDRDTILFTHEDASKIAPIYAALMERLTGSPHEVQGTATPSGGEAAVAIQVVVAIGVIGVAIWAFW